MGRKKIRIERIAQPKNRLVTFNKRRMGLMKKAMELSVLCDCDIAILVFTADNNLYTYSSSPMQSIMERYDNYDGPYDAITNNVETSKTNDESNVIAGSSSSSHPTTRYKTSKKRKMDSRSHDEQAAAGGHKSDSYAHSVNAAVLRASPQLNGTTAAQYNSNGVASAMPLSYYQYNAATAASLNALAAAATTSASSGAQPQPPPLLHAMSLTAPPLHHVGSLTQHPQHSAAYAHAFPYSPLPTSIVSMPIPTTPAPFNAMPPTPNAVQINNSIISAQPARTSPTPRIVNAQPLTANSDTSTAESDGGTELGESSTTLSKRRHAFNRNLILDIPLKADAAAMAVHKANETQQTADEANQTQQHQQNQQQQQQQQQQGGSQPLQYDSQQQQQQHAMQMMSLAQIQYAQQLQQHQLQQQHMIQMQQQSALPASDVTHSGFVHIAASSLPSPSTFFNSADSTLTALNTPMTTESVYMQMSLTAAATGPQTAGRNSGSTPLHSPNIQSLSSFTPPWPPGQTAAAAAVGVTMSALTSSASDLTTATADSAGIDSGNV